MPNHVANRITLKGDPAKLEAFIERLERPILNSERYSTRGILLMFEKQLLTPGASLDDALPDEAIQAFAEKLSLPVEVLLEAEMGDLIAQRLDQAWNRSALSSLAFLEASLDRGALAQLCERVAFDQDWPRRLSDKPKEGLPEVLRSRLISPIQVKPKSEFDFSTWKPLNYMSSILGFNGSLFGSAYRKSPLYELDVIFNGSACKSTPAVSDGAKLLTKIYSAYADHVKSWGTKWNAYDIQINCSGDQLDIWFDTAWSPPSPVIEAILDDRNFESLDIRHAYAEVGSGFCGVTSRHKGFIDRLEGDLVICADDCEGEDQPECQTEIPRWLPEMRDYGG